MIILSVLAGMVLPRAGIIIARILYGIATENDH